MGLVSPILVPEMIIEYMKHLGLGWFRYDSLGTPSRRLSPQRLPMPRLRIQALEEPNGSLSDQIW